VHVDDGMAERGVALDDGGCDLLRFVGGVVEKLNFEPVAGIVHCADGFEQTVDHELLVVDGQLHGDAGQFREMAKGGGIVVFPVLEIDIDELVTVHTVNGQNEHHSEIWKEQRQIKGVPAIEALECLVGVLHFEKVAQAVLGCEEGQERRYRQTARQSGGEI